MNELAEIQAAAERLSPQQKEELLRFLAARIQDTSGRKARLIRRDGDALLEAPPDAPPMTPETVKRILEDWP